MSPVADTGLVGRIFDIERYSTHDGPGIRTTLFLKGCYLRCAWCHNPESMNPRPELMFNPDRCLLDLGCAAACPHQALYFVDSDDQPIPPERADYFAAHKEEIGGRHYDADLCARCGACVDNCFAQALELAGRTVTAAEALVELERDRPFYKNDGGVTISGGEPLCQHRFVAELLRQCRSSGLHTALDTTAFGKWKPLHDVAQQADLVLLDLKHMDPEQHRRWTGVDNASILANARRLAALIGEREGATGPTSAHTGIWVRIPTIPTVNDDEANMRATARFVGDQLQGAVKAVELLGYHKLGGAKAERLGREAGLEGIEPPSPQHLRDLTALWEGELQGAGIEIRTR